MMTLEQTLTSPTTPLTLPLSLAVTPVTSTSSRGADPMGRVESAAAGICQEAQGEGEGVKLPYLKIDSMILLCMHIIAIEGT